MGQQYDTGADELIPHASDLAAKFLSVIQSRTKEEGLNIEFLPVRQKRGDRIILQATLQFGKFMRAGKPHKLEVYADPQGRGLHVGWQLTSDDLMLMKVLSDNTAFSASMLERADMHPENQRQLTGTLQAFNNFVFDPVVSLLVDAVERRLKS